MCKHGHLWSEFGFTNSQGNRACKMCQRIRLKKWQQNSDPKHVENYLRKKERTYRQTNPFKTKARSQLHTQTKNGSITKSKTCNKCNLETPIEAHHYDYARSFDVLWLCKSCHEWLHHIKIGELV